MTSAIGMVPPGGLAPIAYNRRRARVVKLVNTRDLKSLGRKALPVRVRPRAPENRSRRPLSTQSSRPILSKAAVHSGGADFANALSALTSRDCGDPKHLYRVRDQESQTLLACAEICPLARGTPAPRERAPPIDGSRAELSSAGTTAAGAPVAIDRARTLSMRSSSRNRPRRIRQPCRRPEWRASPSLAAVDALFPTRFVAETRYSPPIVEPGKNGSERCGRR